MAGGQRTQAKSNPQECKIGPNYARNMQVETSHNNNARQERTISMCTLLFGKYFIGVSSSAQPSSSLVHVPSLLLQASTSMLCQAYELHCLLFPLTLFCACCWPFSCVTLLESYSKISAVCIMHSCFPSSCPARLRVCCSFGHATAPFLSAGSFLNAPLWSSDDDLGYEDHRPILSQKTRNSNMVDQINQDRR